MHFVVKWSGDGQFFFDIVADNNRILCHSETYHNKADVYDAISIIQTDANRARIDDRTPTIPRR